jgi:hypothetical protein
MIVLFEIKIWKKEFRLESGELKMSGSSVPTHEGT